MNRIQLVHVLLVGVFSVTARAAQEEKTFRWEIRGAREKAPNADIPLSTTFGSRAAAEEELRQTRFSYFDERGLLFASDDKPVGMYVMTYEVGDDGVLRPAADAMVHGDRVSAKFRSEVFDVARRLKIDVNDLMTVMAIETSTNVGGRMVPTFDPSIRNPGSTAVGLIQFIEETAASLGTSTEKLGKMSAVDQLQYVEKYLKPYVGRMEDVDDVYFAVFYPEAIGEDDDFVLPQKIYGPNKALDKDGNGKLTRGEIAAFVHRTHERASRNRAKPVLP